ncbi:MAG TPA: hypothetical protein VM347_29865, partial [Nonomuraea sp.]|nr:hypothetical protein [Nonomuraea sp.]
PDALRRLSSLAIRYLKRDVEPPAKELMRVPDDALARFEGYYHRADGRHQIQNALGFPLRGMDLRRERDQLVMTPTFGASRRLVAVNDALFRLEDELTASLAFTNIDGRMVLAGSHLYAERRARWPFVLLQGGLAGAIATAVLSPFAGVAVWIRRRRHGSALALRGLLPALWAAALGVMAGAAWAVTTGDAIDFALPSLRAVIIFASSVFYPILAVIIAAVTAQAWAERPGLWHGLRAVAVMLAHGALAIYLGWWELVGFRSWTY